MKGLDNIDDLFLAAAKSSPIIYAYQSLGKRERLDERTVFMMTVIALADEVRGLKAALEHEIASRPRPVILER